MKQPSECHRPRNWLHRASGLFKEKSVAGWVCYGVGMGVVFWSVVDGVDLPAWIVLKVYLILSIASGFISAFTDKN